MADCKHPLPTLLMHGQDSNAIVCGEDGCGRILTGREVHGAVKAHLAAQRRTAKEAKQAVCPHSLHKIYVKHGVADGGTACCACDKALTAVEVLHSAVMYTGELRRGIAAEAHTHQQPTESRETTGASGERYEPPRGHPPYAIVCAPDGTPTTEASVCSKEHGGCGQILGLKDTLAAILDELCDHRRSLHNRAQRQCLNSPPA